MVIDFDFATTRVFLRIIPIVISDIRILNNNDKLRS